MPYNSINSKIKIVAVIPARSGSKGVPNKNIKPLAGKPLIAYSIAAAKKSKLINRIIVSTDSEKYASFAKENGAETPFLRPAELAVDKSTDYEYIEHLLSWLKSNENYQPDYIVILRPVTPLRDPAIIDSAIDDFINNPEATSLRSAHEMSETAYKKVEIENNYFVTAITKSLDLDSANKPRQGFPKTYSPNGYIDVLKTSFVLENKMILGNRVIPFITPRTCEIDMEEDFEFIEWQINKNDEIIKKLFGG